MSGSISRPGLLFGCDLFFCLWAGQIGLIFEHGLFEFGQAFVQTSLLRWAEGMLPAQPQISLFSPACQVSSNSLLSLCLSVCLSVCRSLFHLSISSLSLLLSYVLSFSGPFKHCQGYGTLQVPKNLNFKQKVDYTTAIRMCKNSDNGRLQVPWQFPAATECMSSFVRKMKDQFSLTVIPDVWWWHPEPHNTPVTGLKHVVCFVCKSYRLKTIVHIVAQSSSTYVPETYELIIVITVIF